MKQRILYLSVLISFTLQTYAFDAVGHRISADIAYENLKCNTRKKLDKMLGKHGMIFASVWSDDI